MLFMCFSRWDAYLFLRTSVSGAIGVIVKITFNKDIQFLNHFSLERCVGIDLVKKLVVEFCGQILKWSCNAYLPSETLFLSLHSTLPEPLELFVFFSKFLKNIKSLMRWVNLQF